ncbi:MAG: DsbE family thiol:disulfide interchange protein [Proteobacteria bacterium]|nr:DsbE family thiol:disulfide interchange protein [Pseudomonadota bacterium]
MSSGSTMPWRDRPAARRHLLYLVPLAIFGVIAVAGGLGLGLDPSEVPSVLIGKSVPEFSLPPVRGRALGLSSADLKGEVSLVNVFASWCTSCRAEHPVLMRVKAEGLVRLHGINYKDKPEDAAKWLDGLGDPYTRTGADLDGRVAIDWGVYGVPETFVIDRQGRITHKHIGAITLKALDDVILPLVADLRSKPAEAEASAKTSR